MLNPECDQVMPGDCVEIPDGFHPNGTPRPWRTVRVIDVIGRRDGLKVEGISHTIPYRSARRASR